MAERRYKDVDWNLEGGPSWERTQTAILMDLRDELKKLNRVLECPNFLAIPHELRLIKKAILRKSPRQRVCTKCHGPIVRGDKWTIAKRGYQHRNCKDPERYR